MFQMKMKGFLLFILSSFMVTVAVVTSAWLQKKQFYPTVVYLTKSSPCVAVLYVQAFVFVLLFAKLARKVFFGQLRAAETEHLIERSWYAVTDTCLAFTMFRDDFSPIFVGAFTLLLFLKSFHWLLEDRVDYMERSPRITILFKLRVLSLLALLFLCDLFFVNLSYHSTITKGPSVQIVFGFEYAILATIVLTIFFKYILHSIDLQSENPWENKTLYMLYIELITGFIRVLLYISFTILMVKVHTFPLFSIRPMYLTMRQFKKALSDIVLSRRAIQNMNNLYPDATAEDLANTDSICIICREEMVATNPNNRTAAGAIKKLPCGHIFHASCLRSWFQRQQTCPTCRLDVLQSANTPEPTPAPPPADAAPVPQPNGPPIQLPFPPPMFPPIPPNAFPRFPPPSNSPSASNETSTESSPPSSTNFPPPPPPLFPPPVASFFGMPPFIPPPVPPSNFSGLSDDQLRNMEGEERKNVEARIECLKNINLLLDAAMIQISQYMTVVGTDSNRLRIHIPAPTTTATADTGKEPSSTDHTATSKNNKDENHVKPVDSTNTGMAGDADIPTSSNVEKKTNPDADEMRKMRLAKLSPEQR